MRRYPAPAGRVCRPGRSPRPIARRSCGTWQLANGAGMSWPAWPRCPPCCAGCPPGPPRSLTVRVPRRPSGMRGRRCWAGCSAGWLCGDAAVGGAGRGRDRAGGHSRYRLGAASGHAPAWAGGSRERPGDRENRRGYRARRRLRIHALLVRPDTATRSNCDGSCARRWPPVTGPSTAGTGVTGAVGWITRSDGSIQATYHGHPLYTASVDTAPGQARGNGVNASGGRWHEVTVPGAAAPASSPAPGPRSGGSGRLHRERRTTTSRRGQLLSCDLRRGEDPGLELGVRSRV